MSTNVRLLALLTLAHVVVDAYATTVPALLPFWQERFALSYALAGLIRAISDVTSSVAQPLVGILTDRGRDQRWIAVACLLTAVGVSLTGLAPGYGVFLASVVAGGLGVSAFHPQGYKLIALYAGNNPAVATSWFLVGGNVGVALGPLIGTAMALRFGVGGTGLLLVPGVIFAATMWWLLPRWSAEAREHPGAGSPELDDGRAKHMRSRQAGATASTLVAGFGINRRVWAVVVLVLFVALRSTISSSLISFVPLYYVRIAGTGEDVASLMLAGMLLTGAVATVAGGYLSDRFGRLRILTLSLVPVPPLILAFLWLPPNSPLAAAALWSVGALITGTFAITVVLAQELWYERRALASGLIVGSAFGMGGLLVPLVGRAADLWGLPAALQLLAALPVAALALLAVFGAILSPTWNRTPATRHNEDNT